MTCDWHGVEMPHALSISLGWVSYGKHRDRIQEARLGALGGVGSQETSGENGYTRC